MADSEQDPLGRCVFQESPPRRSAPSPPHESPKFSLRRMLIACYIVVPAILLGSPMLLYLIGPRENVGHGRAGQSASRSSELVKAMHLYEADHGRLPPATITKHGHKHSWRVLLLPYLEHQLVYDEYRFEEPWNSPHNARVTDVTIDNYRSPRMDYNPANKTSASYLAVVGDETAFPRDENVALKSTEMPDGSTRTIALVETIRTDIHWAEPRDLDFDTFDFQINNSRHGIAAFGKMRAAIAFIGTNAILNSGSVPPDVVRAWLTREGREHSPDPEDYSE